MRSRPARLARGAVAGAGAVLAAAVSHATAGGGVPSGLAIGAALIFATMLGTALTATRPSLPRLTALVALSQGAFHLGFVLLGTGGSVVGSAHAHHGATAAGSLAIDPDGVAAAPGHEVAGAAGMWLAHAVAALVTVVILRHAESAAWAMLVHGFTWLAAAVLRTQHGATPASTAVRAPLGTGSAAAPATHDPRHAVHRRGPPALSFA